MSSKISLPESLKPLETIAYNLWWSFNQECFDLFEELSPVIWKETRSPIKVLLGVDKSKLEEFASNEIFLKKVNTLQSSLTNYMEEKNTWYSQNYKDFSNEHIAYFSAEYGIHESLPIYSGGLGILSGDHVKSSSDLGIPMSFIGLFYKNGYFIQHINEDGKQVDEYNHYAPEELPMSEVMVDGSPLRVQVNLSGRDLSIAVFKVQVGRNSLYLLDTNLPENTTADRELTAKLYGGDREMRISQEIVLGIGGVKVLKALEIKPTAWHMNEGHSGFFQLERVFNAITEDGLSFEEARLKVATNCLFTTHTPVPAGNEAFDLPLMHKYFYDYVGKLGISWYRFLNLGLVEEQTDYKYFSLTVFAINFSRRQNGVSELHGRISKKMWRDNWKDVPEIDNSITHITNGIHVDTWTSLPIKNLFDKHLGTDWRNNLRSTEFFNKFYDVPNEDLISTKKENKIKLIKLVREYLTTQLQRNCESPQEVAKIQDYLDPNALTIGFARRFATYKRATLIFKDLEKLKQLINDSDRPVQFIFAGKAHPADIPGQKYIEEIYKFSRQEDFKGKIIILENYDMNISRHMVAGVDVWLNNPRRPMEASGTSGQKVPINGGLNFSVLDGWWREGHDGENGWAIGKEKDYPNEDIQDFEDANDFYLTLGESIMPLYYDNHNGWQDKCKRSLVTNIANFSTYRMVSDYMNQLYINCIADGREFRGTKKGNIESYLNKARFLKRNWSSITVSNFHMSGSSLEVDSKFEEVHNTPHYHVEFPLDDTLPGRVFQTSNTDIHMDIYLGDLNPDNIGIEMVITDPESNINEMETLQLENTTVENGIFHYKGSFKSLNGKDKHLRCRVYPILENQANKFELGLSSWV